MSQFGDNVNEYVQPSHSRDYKDGYDIGKKMSKNLHTSPKTMFLSLVVIFVVYGLLYMMNTYWFWALLLSLFAGWLFWYLCEKCEEIPFV